MNIRRENNTGLREQLQDIADNYTKDQIGEQIDLISDLSQEHHHSIRLIKRIDPKNRTSWNYNCYAYAFDLVNSMNLRTAVIRSDNPLPDRTFVFTLIENVLQERNRPTDEEECYIVYSSGTEITHAGKIKSGRIVSKWGDGHIWEHAIFEVPWKYGDDVRYFRTICEEKCVEEFRKWKLDRQRKQDPNCFLDVQ